MMSNNSNSLWQPSDSFKKGSNLYAYEQWLKTTHQLEFDNYQELWEWSVKDYPQFWSSLWEYFDIISHSNQTNTTNGLPMPHTRWFEGATLNYAEHIFRKKSDRRPAILFKQEQQAVRKISWQELEHSVAKLQAALIDMGIKKGDCVAAYIPNIPEAIVSFIAVNSLGAIWSCCSPDFGVNTVLDRFEQIAPKVLIATDGYVYSGKSLNRLEEVRKIASHINSIEEVILVPYLDKQPQPNFECTSWDTIQGRKEQDVVFTPVEFNDPIWVLYSSGTTGKPKAITHSNGGVLLEHLKYMHFHNDVKEGENFFWFTTTGWMMWNFLQASLLAGATCVLYDGSPAKPNLNTLWELAEELPIHHFGTSAPYLTACMKEGLQPSTLDLSALRSIGSTGAPLPEEAFEWVYNAISKDVWLCSMSGGTDVCTAFVGGIPYKEVVKGRIQGRALGCALVSYSDDAEPIFNSLGEMVITQPMPSMPIYFWGDEDHARYKQSYFERFDGAWCHGDWIKIFEDGSLIIQGRSDATLNRKGIRIGTAEIYAQLNKLDQVKDSLIINLERPQGEDYMPLFVVLKDETEIEPVTTLINKTLKEQCSPRHVPDQVLSVPDIPYTLSGKKMEVPVKKALMGMDIEKSMNKDACRNPDAMEYFIRLAEQLKY